MIQTKLRDRQRRRLQLPLGDHREMQMGSDQLLDEVRDRDSFIAFVRALAEEREAAQKVEQANPERHVVDGAHGWKNADIASFLYAALHYFSERPFFQPEREPSWRMLAEFLYHGKIIE